MPCCPSPERPRQRAEARLRELAARLPPGARLPSQRVLAAALAQPRPTVARALAALRAEGVLAAAGRGLAVIGDPALPATLDRNLVLVAPSDAPPDDPAVRAALARIRARGWQVIPVTTASASR